MTRKIRAFAFVLVGLTNLVVPSLASTDDQQVLVIQVPGLGDDDRLGNDNQPGFDGWIRLEAAQRGWTDPVGINLPHTWGWVPRLLAEKPIPTVHPKWERVIAKYLQEKVHPVIKTFLDRNPDGQVLIVTHSAGCSVFKPLSEWAKDREIAERVTFLLNSPQATARTLNRIKKETGIRLFTADSVFDPLNVSGGSSIARYISVSIQDRCPNNHSVMILDTESVFNLSVNGRLCYGAMTEFWGVILDMILGNLHDPVWGPAPDALSGNAGVFPGGYMPIPEPTPPRSPRVSLKELLGDRQHDQPVKEDEVGNSVRSTETTDEDGEPVTGIEAGPVVSRMLVPALMGQVRWRLGSALNMRDVLPTVGPHGTNRVGPLSVNQVLTEGNAVEAVAYEFREGRHFTSTKAVALVMKTHSEAYEHDYPICPRFHLNSLDNLAAIPLSLAGSGDKEAWFWFSSIFDNRSENVEVGCHFAVFVNEANRELIVDSRWIDKQYSPYWRSPQAKPYGYILNFQVWSYSAEETIKLVRSVLQRFPEGWNVRYANREEPTQPTVFVEEAWISGNTVHLSVWNRSWLPVMTCFHGTTDAEENPFEEWVTVYPGRNTVRLSLRASFDATIHCEVNGFIDKVYVSRKRTQRSAQPAELRTFGRPSVSDAAERPSIHIVWPPADAKVVTLQDQLDMPRDDNGKRLAINGICPGAPAGSRVAVQVHTDRWYPHKGRQPEIKDGAWGVRAYLSGEGEYNKHWIHAALYDRHGKKLAEDRVGPIYRVTPLPERAEGRRVAPDSLVEPRQEFQPITIDAGKFRVTGTARMPDGSIIIGGGRDGPHGRGGTAESRVNLPQDASGLVLEISMWHGTPGQMGHGIHGKVKEGKVVVLVNEVPVHTIMCRHRHMFGDWWPEPAPELGRTLPPVDLKEKGIKGRSVEIKIRVDSHTCMNLKSIDVKPVVR